ncbi:hypothetical protein F0562_013418 [Nyssa sinensis]|uniref:Uncharacterized protein n=1 Tax=Nyssa sinensis TaxID=561372 RepID=A0A5J4ZNV7_9ASTE|nr:hypothetical protein F0562_013418 [Nyssa sinensis]
MEQRWVWDRRWQDGTIVNGVALEAVDRTVVEIKGKEDFEDGTVVATMVNFDMDKDEDESSSRSSVADVAASPVMTRKRLRMGLQ